MDEPTAALADHEVELLYRLVAPAAGPGHRGPLHLPPTARGVRPRRPGHRAQGRRAASAPRPPPSITSDELVRLMVGRDLGTYFPPRADRDLGTVRLAVRGGGNAGSTTSTCSCAPGRSSGGRAAGLGPHASSRGRSSASSRSPAATMIDGGPAVGTAPAGRAAGIGLVTEDRKAEGLALRQSVRDNALLVAAPRCGGTRAAHAPTCRRARAGRLSSPRRRAPGGPLPVRRQPAEGRAGQMDRGGAAGPDLRRADARHRRRRQGRRSTT